MIKQTFLGLATLAFVACGQSLSIKVANHTQIDRKNETIEIAWSEFAGLKKLTPENILVVDSLGEQIPSQVLYQGQNTPQALIFQVDLEKNGSKTFKIENGLRQEYVQKTFGRLVPERLDDYAWENNLAAYRLYGPALETAEGQLLVTPGIDVWCKSTEGLVIDKWYAKDNYHRNDGDGMDCYKVGVTLGGGASAPMTNGKLWLSRNYATQQNLDNGPIRTSVKLTYAPFMVDSTSVRLTKYITLDANQSLNRMINIYDGEFDRLPIAAGFVRHTVKKTENSDLYLTMCEEVSDSKDPQGDGDIYFAVAMKDAKMLADTLGHAVALREVKSHEQLDYLAGGRWSQGGIESMEQWHEVVAREAAALVEPLVVTIKK